VRICDKGGIEVGELTPSFEEKSICYFDRAGPVNTRKLCELVASRVRKGIKYVVVTSTSGSTALMMADELKDLDAKLIVFTIPPVWKDIFPFIPTIRGQMKEMLEAKGFCLPLSVALIPSNVLVHKGTSDKLIQSQFGRFSMASGVKGSRPLLRRFSQP